MQQAISSVRNGFTARPLPRFQANEGPNPGTSAINSALLVFLPEPSTGAADSDFVTQGTPGSTWAVTVSPITNGSVGATVATVVVPVADNLLWFPLDPAVTPAGEYRVEIRDPGNFLADQFDFAVFDQNAATGAADVQAINNAIRRVAGLLGYRQRVSYSSYYTAQHRLADVELLSDTGAIIARYRNKVTIDSAGHILGEVSVAMDSNNLGS